MNDIHEQLRIFLSFLLLGFICGVLIDIYRSFCAVLRPRRSALFFLDLFLWIILTLILVPGFFILTWGELRFPLFLALAAGLFLYIRFYSQFFLPLWFLIFRKAVKACKWFISLISKTKKYKQKS